MQESRLNNMEMCEHGGVQYLIYNEERYMCYDCTKYHFDFRN